MPTVISIASGKGGVGKSFVTCNLGYLLAKSGKRVILADLDVGGADLHILFGVFKPEYTIGSFLQKDIDSLNDALIDIDICENLSLLPGASDTLATANPSYPAKKKLINHLGKLDTDIVIIDIGAGANYHALDFFLMADYHLVVTNLEPTAIFDAYRFIKLASIRNVLSHFVSNSQIGDDLLKKDFSSMEEIFALLDMSEDSAKAEAQQAMQNFAPMLLLNKSKNNANNFNSTQLRKILKKYVGNDLYVLGDIPADKNVEKTINSYSPLTMIQPNSVASRALKITAHKLQQQIGA